MIHRQRTQDALLHRRDPSRLPVATSVQAKDDQHLTETQRDRPLLLIDIDGVISLFGFEPGSRPEGSFHSIDGIPHFLSAEAAEHLLTLTAAFELAWASGWEEKANEYLPHLLGLPALPHLSFDRRVRGTRRTNAHWKLDSIDAYAASRPLAWIDDAFNDACHEWAQARPAPTLLVRTEPATGLTDLERAALLAFAGTCREQAAGLRHQES
jgi:hypothetical protein